jgi:hypothetical protein
VEAEYRWKDFNEIGNGEMGNHTKWHEAFLCNSPEVWYLTYDCLGAQKREARIPYSALRRYLYRWRSLWVAERRSNQANAKPGPRIGYNVICTTQKVSSTSFFGPHGEHLSSPRRGVLI